MPDDVTIYGPNGATKQVPSGEVRMWTENGWSITPPEAQKPQGNWIHSNKLVADYVYAKNGVVYFAYDISDLVGYPSYISYAANGLNPNKYTTNWGVDAAGNNRTGPRLSNTPPPGEVIEDPSLTMTGFAVGGDWAAVNMTIDPTTGNRINANGFSSFVFSGFQELETSYPWLFDEVNGQAVGLTLLFKALALGTTLTSEQLSRAGLTTGYTQGQLDYINATILTGGDDPLSFNLNGDSVTNQKYAKLIGGTKDKLDTALEGIGISPEAFERENAELYENLWNQVTRGKVTATLLDEYLGFVLGIEGYDYSKDSDFYSIFSGPRSELNNTTWKQDTSSFTSGINAKSSALSWIGLNRWNALSKEEQNSLVELFANDKTAFDTRMQTMFDNDPVFGERFGGKNLKYSQVVGPYKGFWQSTFGEVADEGDEGFLEGLGLSQMDAKKLYRTSAYNKRNEFFMNTMADNITTSLGGNIQGGFRIA